MAICENQYNYIRDNKGCLRVYIETGLLRGDSVQVALDLGFEKIISIEYHKEYIEKATERFRSEVDAGLVKLVHGDSGITLEKVLLDIDESALIYLDAHAHEAGRCPLSLELEAIRNHNFDHLVMVDDVWFIENAINNPHRAPWANEFSFEKIKEDIANVFSPPVELHKIPYASEAYSDGGRNYTLVAKNKDY